MSFCRQDFPVPQISGTPRKGLEVNADKSKVMVLGGKEGLACDPCEWRIIGESVTFQILEVCVCVCVVGWWEMGE